MSREVPGEARALVQVTGAMSSDPVRGTHELALTVVNHSRWTLTEVRVSVDGETGGAFEAKDYVLRARGTVGPGQTETLSTLLDADTGFGRPPAWRYVGAVGYPPGS